ncbi:MAG: metal-dependent hydrolase [Bryobacterales bacterium]|nr:metal-dependent hydrolase [Bryobacterales bacterium]
MDITWLGHGTFQLRLESGAVLLIDPWINGNPKYPAGFEIERVDTMLLTHGHFDHVADAVAIARRFNPAVISNYEVAHWLESKGVGQTTGMNKGGSTQAHEVKVTMTHAIHSSGIVDDGRMIYGGEPAGFVLRWEDGRSLYFAGDTNVFSDMALIRELYKPRLAFLPIGDLFTMGPDEAAMACRLLKPSQVIPMHFGTFPPLTGRPADVAERLKDQPETTIWELEPGQPVQW